MSRALRSAGLLLVLLALAWAGGCDSAGGRLPVSGTVTVQGKPLDEGVIEFVPLAPPDPGKPYAQSGAAIRDGAYAIPKSQGLMPGQYKVLISAGIKQEATGDEAPGPSGGGKAGVLDRIPPEWNVRSKQVVEVKKEGPNAFNFAIP